MEYEAVCLEIISIAVVQVVLEHCGVVSLHEWKSELGLWDKVRPSWEAVEVSPAVSAEHEPPDPFQFVEDASGLKLSDSVAFPYSEDEGSEANVICVAVGSPDSEDFLTAVDVAVPI